MLLVMILCHSWSLAPVQGQAKKDQEKQLATIQGVIRNDVREAFRVDYEEIKTSLRKVVVPPPPPFPNGWEKLKPETTTAVAEEIYRKRPRKEISERT